MQLVVDASVALKWFFQGRADEQGAESSLRILDALDAGQIGMVQPPHFVAEMAAVLIREKGDAAYQDLEDLQALDWLCSDNASCYEDAMAISSQLQHHLFDTLYHALALRLEDGLLVTADQRYYSKASQLGSIRMIEELAVLSR
jgi:predicted nucleic acid-binding protein